MEFTRDGEFSTNSAYLLSIENEPTGVPFMGQWIWKIDILPKIIIFLWLCFHSSVPVKSILVARGINCDGKCPICRSHDESIIHLLRDCELTHKYWRSIEVPPECVNTFTRSLEGWLHSNSVNFVLHRSGIPWSTVYLFTIWAVWKNRNKIVFDNSIPNPKLPNDCLNQAREYHICVSKGKKTNA